MKRADQTDSPDSFPKVCCSPREFHEQVAIKVSQMTLENDSGREYDEKKQIDSVPKKLTQSSIRQLSANSLNTEHLGTPKQSKLARQLGAATITILVATILLNMLVVGVMSFLWYGNSNSTVWHKIMLRGWATRAVTVTALILRTSVDLQAGVATAMIAALSLEHGTVAVTDVAKWSIARASKPRPRTLLFPSVRSNSRGLHKWKMVPVIPILILCGTMVILQLASTVLLSDFGTGVLQSFPLRSSMMYNYVYPSLRSEGTLPGGWDWPSLDPTRYPQKHRTTTWLRNPPVFPAFAEYSIPLKGQRHNVDDTGVLLRAFLPYSDATLRQSISGFDGKTIVLDSRVSCQNPILKKLSASERATGFNSLRTSDLVQQSFTAVQINGTIGPSKTNVDRLYVRDLAILFSCFAGIGSNAISICQLNAIPDDNWVHHNGFNQAGGLLSEFANVTNVQWPRDKGYVRVQGVDIPRIISWGAPFLILQTMESGPVHIEEQLANITQTITPAPTSHSNSSDQWTVITEEVSWHPWKVRASLCYTAWDIAPLDVSISGKRNRTEPLQHWSAQDGFYTTPNITEQLLSVSTRQKSSRQILSLKEKNSWVPLPQDVTPINAMPFVQAYADMSSRSFMPNAALAANYTAILTDSSLAPSLEIGVPSATGTNQQMILARRIYCLDIPRPHEVQQ